jgi:hypothetical protein
VFKLSGEFKNANPKMNLKSFTIHFTLIALYILNIAAEEQEADGNLSEEERILEYHKRGYTWPPEPYVPFITYDPWFLYQHFSNI